MERIFFCFVLIVLYSQSICICIFLFTGGGAIEMELSKMLRDYSRTIAGKEQLLISALAKALEIIPRQLCDNAGFDATNILNKLRQKHAQGESHFFFDYLFICINIYMC